MANDIVSGLFGLSPMQVRQQQQANLASQAQQYAQQDPFQRATAGMYQAGAGLAQAGAEGLFGMQNPEVVAAQQREALLGQIDMQTPEGILQGAELARQRGDVRMQLQLQLLAQQRKDEIQQAELLAAKTKKEEMLAEEQPRLRHEEAMAAIAQRAEAAKMRSEDMRLTAQMRADAIRESNDLKRLLASQNPQKFSSRDEMRVQKASEAASAATDARMLLDSFDSTLEKYKGRLGAAGTLSGEANRWFGKDPNLVADYETMNAWSSELGAKTLQLFGGSDTEKELEVAIRTNPSVDKTYAANKEIIKAKRAALAVAENLQPFQEEWLAENGSLLKKNSNGETFSSAWKRFQRENFKPENSGNSAGMKPVTSGGWSAKIKR